MSDLMQDCWDNMLSAAESKDWAAAAATAEMLLEQASDASKHIDTGIASRLGSNWHRAVVVSITAIVIARSGQG